MVKSKIPILKILYKEKVVPILIKELSLKNKMQVPKLEKIVLNMGLGDAIKNSKCIENSMNVMMLISGQRPVITKAKKSIASFKLRKGTQIGIKVTIRNNKMWDFLYRFINIALPRVRDFRGIFSKFDGNGNLSIGIKEQIIFPEIDYDKIDKIRGFNVTIVTNAINNLSGKLLCKCLGIPFRN
jgi:large subunit ribosomal protein L5